MQIDTKCKKKSRALRALELNRRAKPPNLSLTDGCKVVGAETRGEGNGFAVVEKKHGFHQHGVLTRYVRL